MFPVREVPVFAELGPGRLARARRSKALVNEWSGDVVSIVGDQYRVLHNSTALELAVRGCAATFPKTDPAAWRVTKVSTSRTFGNCTLEICYRPGAEPLVYNWKFALDRIETYEPFFQMKNGYNGRTAFSLRFGVVRQHCENGFFAPSSVRLAKVDHDHRDMEVSIDEAIQEAAFGRHAAQIKAQLSRLWQIEIPREQFAPVTHAVLGIRRPKRMDESTRGAWMDLRRVVEGKRDRYVAELGSTAYALMAVLTDLATRPPARRPFIFRERHSLQQVAGRWMYQFDAIASRSGFDLADYIHQLTPPNVELE